MVPRQKTCNSAESDLQLCGMTHPEVGRLIKAAGSICALHEADCQWNPGHFKACCQLRMYSSKLGKGFCVPAAAQD